MRRRWSVIIGLIVLVVATSAVILWPKPPTFDPLILKTSVSLPYQSAWNDRQSFNACGPYAATDAMRILGNPYLDPAQVTALTWRLWNGYTIPWALQAVLHHFGHKTEALHTASLPDGFKLRVLQDRLSRGEPVIVLGRFHNAEHYMTLVGYDQGPGVFYVYDPLEDKGENGQTIDTNAEQPGNRTMSDVELLSGWSEGGALGFFRFYAVAVSM